MVMGEEKLLALGKYLRDTGHTQASIASQLGVSQPYVNALLTGRKAFGKSQAKKWGDLYGLSPSWLLTGEGSMLKADAPITQTSPESSVRPLVSSDRDWVEIPLVPHRAKAGALSGFGDPCWEEDKQTMPVLIDKRLKGDYLLFEVSGDSMDDGTSTAFLDGDVLLCRVLPKSDWQYGIKRRRDTYCVVATEAEGIVLKEVVNHDKATNEITCHSLNSQYKDYSVKLDDVQGIFYVEELIKRRF